MKHKLAIIISSALTGALVSPGLTQSPAVPDAPASQSSAMRNLAATVSAEVLADLAITRPAELAQLLVGLKPT